MSFKEGLRKIFNPTEKEKKDYRKQKLEDLSFAKKEAELKAQIAKLKAQEKKNTPKKEEWLI